jgi:Holliday junction DNA helicase RuvA
VISRIAGELVAVGEGRVELRCGRVTYALLVPAADQERLAGLEGREVRFHTLHFLEGQGKGTSFTPRLIGFASAEARAFFELLTTVRGLGPRKALRALRVPWQTVAEAIAGRDVEMLMTLPEIGRRSAETIVAELHGKVDRFLGEPAADAEGAPAASGRPAIVRDAIQAMERLGEPRPYARRLVEKALAGDPALETADALLAAAYRLREGD